MGRGGKRSGPGVVAVVAAALAQLVVLAGCGSARESNASPSCTDAILSDWADGRIDGVYDAECYLAAIDALPEDVRAYSSAEDDISRALLSLRASGADAGSETVSRAASPTPTASAPADDSGLRQAPTALVALAGVAVVVLSGGLAAALARRHRRRA
jgi:hypothetical protein